MDSGSGKEVHIPEFKALKLTFELDQQSMRYNYQANIKIYADVSLTHLVRSVDVSPFSPSQEVILNKNVFWYTTSSIYYYVGMRQAMSINITIRELTGPATSNRPDSLALTGDIELALEFIDLAMRAGQRVPKSALILLLKSLTNAPSADTAQHICRMAIRLFNHYNELLEPETTETKEKDKDKSTDSADTKVVKSLLKNLESAHSSLRTDLLVNWTAGSMPGSHLQNLLELVLAGRKAVGESEPEKDEDEEEEEDRNPVEPHTLRAFNNFRDGQESVSLININERRITAETDLVSSAQAQSNVRDIWIGDVALRGGGKWYFEVTLKSVPQYIAIGFVTRQYRTGNYYSNFGCDTQGNSWGVSGPHTVYYHRNIAHTPQQASGRQAVVPTWQVGSVIGVALDLDEREIRYVFDGKTSGIAFSGFETNEGLYPCVSLGRQCQLEVNFGRDQFQHLPEVGGWKGIVGDDDETEDDKKKDPKDKTPTGEEDTGKKTKKEKEKGRKKGKKRGKGKSKGAAKGKPEEDIKEVLKGYSGIEDSRLKGSSWLARYRLASDVTHLIYERSPLPESLVQQALDREVSLAASDMDFEIHKAEGTDSGASSSMGPENILTEDHTYFMPSKNSNLHIIFNAIGKDTDFLLQEVNVRCNMSVMGFYGLVFLSQKVPDLDSFSWCNDFRQDQYDRFAAGKKGSAQALRSHEPVAFFSSEGTSIARVKLLRLDEQNILPLKSLLQVLVHDY